MKKYIKQIIIFYIVAITLFSFTACDLSAIIDRFSKPKFESKEAMFHITNGLWLIDESSSDTYLMIQDDKIQQIELDAYKRAISTVMLSTLENNGLDALRKVTFQNVLTKIADSSTLVSTDYEVTADADKGILILSNSNMFVRHIIVTENTVGIKDESSDVITPLKKISDSANLSAEPFETLFLHTKNYFNIPINTFWMDSRSFGSYIKQSEASNDYWWTLTSDTEEATIYETNKYISTISGALIIDDEAVDYIYRIHIDSMDPDFEPYFMIQYRPEEGKITIIDNDNTSLSLLRLIRIGGQAVSAYPGAYDDYIDLNNALAEVKPTVSNGISTVELERNGLTYTMQYTADGSYAQFSIVCESNISLNDILQMIPVCSQCNKEEPATTFDPNWEAGDRCLICSGEDVRICPFCNRSYHYEGVDYCDDCMP